MHYLELVLSVIATAVTLGFFVYHLFRKQKEAIHYMFAFAAFAASAFYSLVFIYLLPQDVLPQLIALRLLAAMLLLMNTLWCVLTETYPFVENKPALLAFLLMGLPGLAVAALAASTDWIIADAGTGWSYREGVYMPFYIAAVIAYCTAIPVILLAKSIFTRNKSFSAELAYFFAGTIIAMTAFFAFPLLVARGAIDQTLCAQGMLVSVFAMTVLFHYAVLDFSTIDFRRFFEMTLYWLLIFALLCVPVYLVLQYKNIVPGLEQVPVAGIAFVLFVYMFFVFKYLRPRIEQLLQKRHQGLSEKLNKSILPITDYAKEGESQSWDEFYGDSTAKLLENFSIRHGVLLVLDSKKRSYKPVFISARFTIPEITPELQQCLDILKSTMSVSMLYTDYRIRHLRQTILALLNCTVLQF